MAVRKLRPVSLVDKKFIKRGQESPLPYGRKGYEQGEGVDVRPGLYDRNAIPDSGFEESEYPRSVPRNFKKGHLRSEENLISRRSHRNNRRSKRS